MLEDNSLEASLIQRLLQKEEQWSCIFQLTDNEESFRLALEEFNPDLVLSDNALPGYDASQALELVRRRSQYLPFLLITGTVNDGSAVKILKAGADDYVLKDRLERLPAAITAVLKQKKTEKELVDYKQALDASSIVAITDQKGTILHANENFCNISKYEMHELIGQNHRILNSGYHTDAFFKDMWRQIGKGNIWRGEFKNKAKDGSFYWVDATIIPFLDGDGRPYQYLSIRNDITEKKQAEESMILMREQMLEQRVQEQKKITRAILEAQEKERNHIGSELHDNVNQILASTKLYLEVAAKSKTDTNELISFSMGLIDNAIEELRVISSKQVTPVKDINLKELVANLLQGLEKSSSIQSKFVYEQAQEPEDDLKLTTYRIIQEQVANIVKHAQASNISVVIQSMNGQLLIQVTDDGNGFDSKQKRNGIGISNMMNRIESFNGKMEIISKPGEGCTIKTLIPV